MRSSQEQFSRVLRFWRLAKPMTYVFSLPVNITTPASTNWLQETIEALVSVRLRRMSLERGYSGR
jgi:hypothetical protein